MFESIDPEPRGFLGRPFVAVVLAVGLGIIAAQVSLRFHLNDFVMSAIAVLTVVVIGYAGERLDISRGDA
jgi:hypothetical protein